MCAVSAITDHYRDKWPVWQPNTIQTAPLVIPSINISLVQWQEYQALKRKMEEYDAKTGQPDCVKPEVAEWEEAVEAYLKKRGIV